MPQNEERAPALTIAKAIERVIDSGETAALATLIDAVANVGAKLLVQSSGARIGSLGDQELDDVVSNFVPRFLESRQEAQVFPGTELAPALADAKARILFERIQPEPRIVICGAGHVGASLAKLVSLLRYRAVLIDDRPEFLTRERFADERIELKVATSWTEAVHGAIGDGRGVSVAVVTRGHNEDEECLRAVMMTNPDYVGLIGSKRRTNIVIDRLRQTGTQEEKLQTVHAPIGLDIGAVTPEEVALAILAEIVARRRGSLGGSLSVWRRGGASKL